MRKLDSEVYSKEHSIFETMSLSVHESAFFKTPRFIHLTSDRVSFYLNRNLVYHKFLYIKVKFSMIKSFLGIIKHFGS